MQDLELLHEGLALMGLGMGFVFVFLTILVFVTTLMSKALGRWYPDPVAPSAEAARQAPTPRRDDELMAVIAAAVHRHRRRR
jgi:oxaloacetate decarboxylase (Na+ extruding) subunit gamma